MYLDMETVPSTSLLLFEVAFIDAYGNTILDTVLNHGKSYQQLIEEHGTAWINRATIAKFYQPTRTHKYSRRMTKLQLATALSELNTSRYIVVDWSCNRLDYRALQDDFGERGPGSCWAPS